MLAFIIRSAFRFFALCILCTMHTTAPAARAYAAPEVENKQPVRLEFFYEPGCTVCERVTVELLPELRARLGDQFTLYQYDISNPSNYEKLLQVQNAFGITENASALFVVDGRTVLAGWKEIHSDLIPTVEQAFTARQSSDTGPIQSSDENRPYTATGIETDTGALVSRRLSEFTFFGTVSTGLIDGINPCAIATLVFLISLLAALRVTGRRLLAAGAAFCAASFITYFAIGFGLFNVIHAFSGFTLLRRIFDIVVIMALLLLSILSFRDAWAYARRQEADSVLVKLPDSAKRTIHAVLRTRFRKRNLMVGAFLAGVMVTAIETVCTGQVYVPFLVFLVKNGFSTALAFTYLLLYNTAFITPLVVALLLAYRGVETKRFLEFSQNNVVVSKFLLGLFFIILAVVLILVQ